MIDRKTFTKEHLLHLLGKYKTDAFNKCAYAIDLMVKNKIIE